MAKGKVVSIENRIPKLKQQRKKKANRRIISLLLLFFSFTGCIIYLQSPLAHVSDISVLGNSVYSAKEISRAAEIKVNTNILMIHSETSEKNVKKLSEIKSAQVDKRWPNKIVITVKEYKRIAYIDNSTEFYPVLENGKVLKAGNTKHNLINAPILFDFTDESKLKKMINSLKKLPDSVLNSISEIHYTPKQTDSHHVTVYMNDGNEVNATIRTFSDKMSLYPSIISQLDPNEKGVIDLEVGSYFKAYEPTEDNASETEEVQ